MVSNGTQTPKMGVELTSQPMPDIIDRQRRLDVHLENRQMTLKQTADKIGDLMKSDVDQMDLYELEDLQGEVQMILYTPGLKGKVLESMFDNNHTLTYMVWTNYLVHNRIPINKDKKISELEVTKTLITKLEVNPFEDITHNV